MLPFSVADLTSGPGLNLGAVEITELGGGEARVGGTGRSR